MKELTEYSEEEIAERRDHAVRRALNTPPQPKKAKPKRKKRNIIPSRNVLND